MKKIASLLIVMALLTSTIFIGKAVPVASQPQCTEELKECPNGVSVARNPARNCEFDPCQGNVPACPADARVCPDGTAFGRDPNNNCQFPACPDVDGNTCAQCKQTYEQCVADEQRIEIAPGPNRDRAIQMGITRCKSEYDI